MKKATLETIRTALVDFGYSDTEVLDELDTELNKGKAEKEARAAAYEQIHDIIVDNLDDTKAMSCADLYVEIGSDIEAKGMNRHNVQYALNSLWQDEIEKIPGKPNTYKRK